MMNWKVSKSTSSMTICKTGMLQFQGQRVLHTKQVSLLLTLTSRTTTHSNVQKLSSWLKFIILTSKPKKVKFVLNQSKTNGFQLWTEFSSLRFCMLWLLIQVQKTQWKMRLQPNLPSARVLSLLKLSNLPTNMRNEK